MVGFMEGRKGGREKRQSVDVLGTVEQSDLFGAWCSLQPSSLAFEGFRMVYQDFLSRSSVPVVLFRKSFLDLD